MPDEYLVALIGAGAAITGGVVTGFFEWFRQHVTRPILCLDFKERDEAYLVSSTYDVNGQPRTSSFVRVRLTNSGKSVAHDCRIFLTDITEINGTQKHPTKFYDAKELPWAGYPKDYAPRPIPPGINSYVDVLRISKDDASWHFCVKALFASQDAIKSYNGTYQLSVLATADNAKPVTCTFFVTFTGEYTTLRTYQGPVASTIV